MQSVIQQQMVPRAVLSTKCGDLFVFDLDALSAVMAAISVNQTCVPSLAHQVPSATWSRHLNSEKTQNVTARPNEEQSLDSYTIHQGDELAASGEFEGYSIEQWAAYGKRKASIASSICKENGVLKHRIQTLLRTCREDTDRSSCSHDGIRDAKQMSHVQLRQLHTDPWAGKSLPQIPQSSELSSKELWSRWSRSYCAFPVGLELVSTGVCGDVLLPMDSDDEVSRTLTSLSCEEGVKMEHNKGEILGHHKQVEKAIEKVTANDNAIDKVLNVPEVAESIVEECLNGNSTIGSTSQVCEGLSLAALKTMLEKRTTEFCQRMDRELGAAHSSPAHVVEDSTTC